MICNLKPYPVMKDSGVPWLGEVPEHWEVRRLGTLVRERRETNDDNNVTDVLSVMRERGVIPYAGTGNVGNKNSDDITRYKIVRPNDIVVNCMNVIIGSVGLSKYTGCLSPVYYVLTRRSEIDDPRYLNAYFQTKPFQLSLVRIGNGILAHRMRIPMELLKCEPFPRPPAAEQAAIVRYLDYMERRIRKYIRAKQKLIKLLEEQKQAIIHRAVTRGLDPNVRLKPSGVERLGDVPAHWVVGRLSHFFTLQRGFDITKEQQRQGTVPVVSSGGVASYHDKATAVGPGVLVGRKGTAGAVHYVETDYWAHDTTLWVNDFKGNVPRFIYHVLNMLDLKRFDTGSANPTINRNVIHPERLAFPPPSEQFQIASKIHVELGMLNLAVSSASHEIALLREYRTRLIADVVTGKLDVREAAARLPDETDEPEPIDATDEPTDNANGENIEEVDDAE